MQHKPMGFLALWKAWSVEFTCSLTVQFLPSTAQEHRFFATPKPPKKKRKTNKKLKYMILLKVIQFNTRQKFFFFFFYNIILAYIGLLSYYTESFQHLKHDGFTMLKVQLHFFIPRMLHRPESLTLSNKQEGSPSMLIIGKAAPSDMHPSISKRGIRKKTSDSQKSKNISHTNNANSDLTLYSNSLSSFS